MPTPNPWDYADKTGAEHAHQAALFMWANMCVNFGFYTANCKEAYTVEGWALNFSSNNPYEFKVPQLEWLHAIHNQGHGDKIRGGIAKAEGVKAGVFDIFLPVPIVNEMKAGLYIELKVGKNQPTNDQLRFQTYARYVRYDADIAYGWLEARAIISRYLKLPLDIPAINVSLT